MQTGNVAPAPAPAPAAAAKKPNLMDMLNATPAQPQVQNSGFGMGGMGMNMGMGGAMGSNMAMGGHRQTASLSSPGFSTSPQTQQPSQNLFGGAPMRPTQMGMAPPSYSSPGASSMGMGMGMGMGAKPPAAAPAKTGNFDDLWNLSLGSTSSTAKPAAGPGKSIKDLEKEKAMAGLWGNQQGRPTGAVPPQPAAFGSFGNAAPPSSSGGGVDDLLL